MGNELKMSWLAPSGVVETFIHDADDADDADDDRGTWNISQELVSQTTKTSFKSANIYLAISLYLYFLYFKHHTYETLPRLPLLYVCVKASNDSSYTHTHTHLHTYTLTHTHTHRRWVSAAINDCTGRYDALKSYTTGNRPKNPLLLHSSLV